MGRGTIRPNAEADSVAVLEITSIPTASGSFRPTEEYLLPADRVAGNGWRRPDYRPHGVLVTLFGRLAELAEYIDSDAIHETVDRCPTKIQ
ncbi:hypothetical protein JCM31271_29950 [Halorubrum trueperi]